MVKPTSLALLLLASALLLVVARARAEEATARASLEEDDECRDGAGECAVSALQRRSSFLNNNFVSSEPDFEFRDDAVVDERHGQGELEDDMDEEPIANSTALVQDGATVTGCYNKNVSLAAQCPLGTTCIVKWDGTWSQCMSCAASTFGKECQKLNDYMRYAAVHTCKRTCMNSKCYNGAWCLHPYKCVTDTALNWGQCVGCHSKKFWHASCHALKPGMLHNAQAVCHRHCTY